MAENGTLTPSQQRTLASLLTERDIRSAAVSAGVSERSIYRWLADPTFKAELARREGELIDQAARRLVTLQDAAIAVFDDVLSSLTAKDADKLRAAQCVLDYLLRLRELSTVEERLRALEAASHE